MVSGPYLLCSLVTNHQPDHGGRSGILRQKGFRFRQISMFWNPQDPQRRFDQVAPDRQAILTVSKFTSGAASTGVADLEAAPEISNKKSL